MIYTSSSGKQIPVEEMPEGYLQNAINKLERETKEMFGDQWENNLPGIHGALVEESEKRSKQVQAGEEG